MDGQDCILLVVGIVAGYYIVAHYRKTGKAA